MANIPVSVLARRVRASAPRLGATRLALVDGPAGSGKTTFANLLAVAAGGQPSRGPSTFDPTAPLPDDAPVQIVHGDDMYEGWGGLRTLDAVLVDQILEPLAAGEHGGFRMWDWHRDQRTHYVPVPTREVLVVEGVGVASPRARALSTLTVWIEAPPAERLRRGIERDGEGMRAEWETWQDTEAQVHRVHATRAAADVRLDGTASFSGAEESR